jgi:protein phosphatase-4 regulatory subunit 3
MSADDAPKTSVSLEPNNEKSSAKSTSITTHEEQTPSSVGDTQSLRYSGSSEPAENGHVDQEAKEVGSRDVNQEIGGEEIETSGEGEPLSESFAESGDSLETTETAEGVLAWSPEEDHEHKRVKVSKCGFFNAVFVMRLIQFPSACF